MRERLNKLSNEKLAMIGVFIVVFAIVISAILAAVAPEVLVGIGALIMVCTFLAVVYGFCYAIVKDIRGEGW